MSYIAKSLVRHVGIILTISLAGYKLSYAAELIADIKNPDGSPVSSVVIYAIPNFEFEQPIKSERQIAEMVQVNKQFQPYILVIEKNTEVAFPNQDDIAHHVYSFSPAHSFELELYKDKNNQTELFDKVGTVDLGCNVHDWMLGYIKVVDTPFFALTDKFGKVRLRELPTGNYTVNVWHPNIDNDLQGATTTLEINENTQFSYQLSTALKQSEENEFIEDFY